MAAASQIEGSPLTIFGQTIFDLFNNATSNFMMPIGACLAMIFIGWQWGADRFKNEITNQGTFEFKAFGVLLFLVKFILPPILVLLLLDFLQII